MRKRDQGQPRSEAPCFARSLVFTFYYTRRIKERTFVFVSKIYLTHPSIMAPSSSSQTNGHENLNLQRPYQSIASLSRVDKNRPSAVVVDSSVPTAQRKERQHPHQAQEQRQERQQMRSDGGKPTKKGIHLTSFAKSAARRMRFGWSCQDAENYGHLVDDRVSFQPLAGKCPSWVLGR